MFKPSERINEGYLDRWHLIPNNRWINIYLHKFMRSDDDRALHDHPWWSVSFLLKGSVTELYYKTDELSLPAPWRKVMLKDNIRRFIPVYRRADHTHRIVLEEGTVAWTLFITGSKSRDWGFHCPKGWKHHKEFTKKDKDGNSAGCGD